VCVRGILEARTSNLLAGWNVALHQRYRTVGPGLNFQTGVALAEHLSLSQTVDLVVSKLEG
jgi:hypothetical protein